ncbi:protein draper isoform X1 [Magallana gigas]|uniref:protein draper isoform X1 n=2 Tax=Magallana gigas TaxID=29159 RepID=UPI0033428427
MGLTNIITCISMVIIVSAFEDLSYKKNATQSPLYPGTSYDASNAVDRNVGTCMRTEGIGLKSVYHSAWWNVDLGGIYNIYSVNILFKNYEGYETRQRGRFAGFSLYIANTSSIKGSTLCYKDEPQLPPLNFTRVCPYVGRYLIFLNERLDETSYPRGYQLQNVFTELCEVIVEGCTKRGVYGSGCDTACPVNCRENDCHIRNGTCFACKPGWKEKTCERKCREGLYGERCSQLCSGNCKENETCNHVTGQCDKGCTTGWKGAMCDKECVDGTFGYDCNGNCSANCLNELPCNKTTGHCEDGCNPGYTDSDCKTRCPFGHFGSACNESCNINCLRKNDILCDHIGGECLNGCEDGYIGTHCNDSCEEGYYGNKCSFDCSQNCKTCRHTDGFCTCKEGWLGYNCTTGCSPGHYGLDCKDNCSGHCINNEPCDHINGVCPSGCQDGYTGARCTNTCAEGYYGGNCSKVCFLNCKTCRHTDGQCSCVAGWMGSNCSIECDQSYGENCRYACGEHCVNQTCDRFNGSCLLGRTDGQSFQKYSEKIRLLTEELIESSKQMLLWIIGFSVALAVCVLFIIITCTITILRKKACNAKRKTEDKQPCLRSTTTAKHPVTTNIVSNYQELNTEKEINAYESILLQ